MGKQRILFVLNALVLIAVIIVMVQCSNSKMKTKFPYKRMSGDSNGNGDWNVKNKKIKRDSTYSYYQDYDFHSSSPHQTRKFAVPKGTVVSLTPALELPVIPKMDGDSVQFHSTFKMSLPLEVTFNDLSLGFLGESLLEPLFIHKKSLWVPQYQNSFDNSIIAPTVASSSHSRKARDLSTGNVTQTLWNARSRTRCESKSLSDRKMMFQKMEMVLSTGFEFPNPRECLLRAICELHEIPKAALGFGLLGEYVMLTVSVTRALKECDAGNDKYFVPFAEAEAAGKSGKCKIYKKKCSKSLFTF